MRTATKNQQKIWAFSLLVFVIWQLGVTNKLFRFRTADTLAAALPQALSLRLSRVSGQESELGQHFDPGDIPDYALNVQQVEQIVHGSTVATPFEITPDLEQSLQNAHLVRASYFAYMVDTFSASAEQKAIKDLNAGEWALIPQMRDRPFIELPNNLQDIQGFSFPVPTRHAIPFTSGEAMDEDLRTNWTTASTFGPYLLLRRVGNSSNHNGI